MMKNLKKLMMIALFVVTSTLLFGGSITICADTTAENTGYCWPTGDGNQECSQGPALTCDGTFTYTAYDPPSIGN